MAQKYAFAYSPGHGFAECMSEMPAVLFFLWQESNALEEYRDTLGEMAILTN